MTKRERILATVDDLVSCFLYYDRKEDKGLPCGAIEKAIKSGEICTHEIVDKFREELEKNI